MMLIAKSKAGRKTAGGTGRSANPANSTGDRDGVPRFRSFVTGSSR
jgi:hypothetical protein